MISIVIPFKGDLLNLVKVIQPLYKAILDEEEIIIIQNNSHADLNTLSKFPKLKIRTIQNINRAQARNIGAKLASQKFILFLDADIYLDSSLLRVIRNYIMQSPYQVFSCPIVPRNIDKNIKLINKYYYYMKKRFTSGYFCLIGPQKSTMDSAFFLIDKKLFFEVNGFPENLAYCEDMAISAILKDRGIFFDLIKNCQVFESLGDSNSFLKYFNKKFLKGFHFARLRFLSNFISPLHIYGKISFPKDLLSLIYILDWLAMITGYGLGRIFFHSNKKDVRNILY